MSEQTPLERDLAEVWRRMRDANRPNQVIAEMHAYSTDLRRQAGTYARAKTEHERVEAHVVLTHRANGEKAASVCERHASEDVDVIAARVAYRLAEQLMTADREHLRVLHAELDKLRTEAADRRAADSFTAREHT